MSDAADATAPDQATDWHAPPARAVRLHAVSAAIWFAAFPLLACAAVWFTSDGDEVWHRLGWCLGVLLLALLAGLLLGARLRHQRWTLDHGGLRLQQGRLWWRETRVPISRVQHVDIKHGPLERRFGLATLVVHTAAVHLSGITVLGLEDADAQHLRDTLAKQLDDGGDAL